MNTPITDAAVASDESVSWAGDAWIDPEIARRLELDRAELMEALVNLERRATFGTVSEECLNESRRAILTARANFP